MASKKSAESNNALLPNVKIKVEPGTSSTQSTPSPPLLKNIKVEPGLTNPTTRLTSFRVPRDLTLGANIKTEKPKKVYTPNINVQRNKKKDDGVPVKKEAKPARGRGRGRGQGEGGRGRGRQPSNLIQSTGVFSEGISSQGRQRSWGSRGGESASSAEAKFMEKPVLKFNQTIDKVDEEEKLKTLLRDDFIDDGSDPCLQNAPVSLPLFGQGKLYKSEVKTQTETKVAVEEEEADVKPIMLPNGEAVMPPKSMKETSKPLIDKKEKKPHDTIPEIFENLTNGYVLIQFPDCLPGLQTSEEPSGDPRSRRQAEQKPAPASEKTAGKSEFCTLSSLKGGLLGKIQICKSGKARFLVGDNTIIVDVGSRPSFRQDLVATKIDSDKANGELVNLGRVNNTLVCSPDWETMLASL